MLFDVQKLKLLPVTPGVYLMKDHEGKVLYVGKAKHLRSRVKQYFTAGGDGRAIIPYLIAKVVDIETIVVSSEKEALLLENNLIKQYQPRYNALLKDDRSYIALKISRKDPWPAVRIVRYRGSADSDALYFGPYTSGHAARQTLDLLQRIFPLRQCSDAEFARRIRPCILYDMKRCIAPCVQKCTREEYAYYVERTIQFLRGQDKEVLKDLYDEIQKFSDHLEFEKAAQVLQTIKVIEKTIEKQHVDRPLGVNVDAIGVTRHGEEVFLVQLVFREGRLTSSRQFEFHQIIEDDGELVSSFLLQHYEAPNEIPPEVLLPISLGNKEEIAEILSSRCTGKVTLHMPQRGEKKILLEMAQKNAEALFQSKKSADSLREKTLLELQERLKLAHYPARIECFDNSHLSGADAVSVKIAFTDGKKESKRYRSYRLKTAAPSDDYGAMYEVLMRCYKRAKEEGNLPDLIVVDGGKGQLSMAQKVLEELNVTTVDVIALAKEEGRHDKGVTEEQVFILEQKEPIVFNKNSPVLFLLQNIRDEAHRFALSFHRKRRSKTLLESELDHVPGIGPAKRKALLVHFGSIRAIKQADEEALAQVKGISQANIASLKKFL